MEAPEKLYLSKNIYSTFVYQAPDLDDETQVEYTRTDAFIDKAKKWFNSKNGIVITDTKALFEEFIDYVGIE